MGAPIFVRFFFEEPTALNQELCGQGIDELDQDDSDGLEVCSPVPGIDLGLSPDLTLDLAAAVRCGKGGADPPVVATGNAGSSRSASIRAHALRQTLAVNGRSIADDASPSRAHGESLTSV